MKVLLTFIFILIILFVASIISATINQDWVTLGLVIATALTLLGIFVGLQVAQNLAQQKFYKEHPESSPASQQAQRQFAESMMPGVTAGMPPVG